MSNAVFLKPEADALNHIKNDFAPDTIFNMDGDYSYMSDGYYHSLEAELAGQAILPTTADALDAYVVPVAIEKAGLNGLAVPDHEITLEKVKLPVLAYPVNPFSNKYEIISQEIHLANQIKKLTMSGKYAILCQSLPTDYRIDVVRCVLGQSLISEYGLFAAKVFEIFKLPLMKVRVIVTADDYLFSAIEPLPFDELTLNEKKLLNGVGSWQK